LWLYGPEGYCTEAGASNFFVVWRTRDGARQLVTAPLDDKLILDGVTRRSVVELARERLKDELEVVERKYTINEVIEADKEGRLIEAFAAGTAVSTPFCSPTSRLQSLRLTGLQFFICPVSQIRHRDYDIQFPMAKGGSGQYTAMIKGWMSDIMYGNEQ